ncbi:hypothetical protein ALC53_00896 [Atta colombica]|uniref:Uncharacterized protein n=1 Tax=Atta colombica TaxID=520822 RepID=A0A195BWV5_9HYME|nr:hypothetical protein ALC53_00896 [Atta colombica]
MPVRFRLLALAIYSCNNVTYFTDVRNVYCIFYSVDKLQLPLPSRASVCSKLVVVVEFAIGLVLELDATKRSRKLDVVTKKIVWIVETYNSADSVETNVRYGITLENPGRRRAKTKEPGGSEWSRVDRAICVDHMRSYGLVLTSSLVLARSSQEWNKVMAILMMVPCGLVAILPH